MKKTVKNKFKAIAIIAAAMAISATSLLSLYSCNKGGDEKESSSEIQSGNESQSETEKETEQKVEMPEYDYMANDLTKYVTLGEYKGFRFEIEEMKTVTDKDVTDQINIDLIANRLCNTTVEGTVAKEDTVCITYKGYMNGEEFKGGSGEKDFFTIFDGGGFIDGFADQLIGATPGKEVTLELKFPEDYREDLAGKPVTFKVVVDHIYVARELTDKTARDLTRNKEMTAEKLRKEYKEMMEKSVESKYKNMKIDMVWKKICESAKEIGLPEDLVKAYYDFDVQYYKSYAQMYGMKYEEFLKNIGLTDEKVKQQAHDNVYREMVIYSVIKAENITIGEEEYKERLEKLSKETETPVEKLLESYKKEELMDMFRYNKVYEGALEYQIFDIKKPEADKNETLTDFT